MFKPTFCTDLVPYLNLILFVNADLLVLVLSTDRNWEHSMNHWRDSSDTEEFYIYFTGVLCLLYVTSIKWNEPFKTTRKICMSYYERWADHIASPHSLRRLWRYKSGLQTDAVFRNRSFYCQCILESSRSFLRMFHVSISILRRTEVAIGSDL